MSLVSKVLSFGTHLVAAFAIPTDLDKDAPPAGSVGTSPGSGNHMGQFVQDRVLKLWSIFLHGEDRRADSDGPALGTGVPRTASEPTTDPDVGPLEG